MRESVLTGALQQIVQFGRWVHAHTQHAVQRLTALFLCLLILSGIAIPPVSVYAAQNEADAIKPVTAGAPHKSTPPDTTTEMKQNFAGAIPQSKAGFKVADTSNLSAVNFNKPTTVAEPSVDELMKKQKQPIDRSKQQEIVGKRDAKTEVFRNNNGSFTQKQYLEPKFYKASGQWKTIDASLIEDKNAADSGNILGKLYGQAQSTVDSEQAFTVKDNDWQARFSPSDFEGGMVRVKKGNDQIGFSPVGAKRVAPVVTKDAKGSYNYLRRRRSPDRQLRPGTSQLLRCRPQTDQHVCKYRAAYRNQVRRRHKRYGCRLVQR
ncbi:MAG TPA: hypothetical protein VGO07_03015 [Candidatus Saccharimonadales bacterium]|jgi:hypothetical protein|nr:hypothetical protein [Candidatus Saccharimonadales bacterium]